MEEMTSLQRVATALSHKEPDRVPVVMIALTIGAREGNVSIKEYATNPKVLAEAQIDYQARYGVDGVTPLSDVAMFAESIGCTTKYYDKQDATPAIGEAVVKKPEDWKKIRDRKPLKEGRIPVILEAGKILVDRIGDRVPVLGPIASPMTMATWAAGLDVTMRDIKRNPELLQEGMDAIADHMIETGKAAMANGVHGFVYVTTRATKDIMTAEQYRRVASPFDLKVLNSFKGKLPVVVHVCGVDPMVHMIADEYPVAGINWWDRGTAYSLAGFKERYAGKVTAMGGLDQTRTLLIGKPADVEAEAKDAIKQAARGGGFVLSGGCELSAITPPENIHAAVAAAKKWGKYPIPEGDW